MTATASSFTSAHNSTFNKDNKAVAAMSVSLITDHPTVPLLCADIQLHAAGFLLEKCDSGKRFQNHASYMLLFAWSYMWDLMCHDYTHLFGITIFAGRSLTVILMLNLHGTLVLSTCAYCGVHGRTRG